MTDKNTDAKTFAYRPGTKITLAVITAALAALTAAAFFDRAAWYGGAPAVALAMIPVLIYFILTIARDGKTRITVTREEIVCESRAGGKHTRVSLAWADVGQLRDATKIFTMGRKFALVSASEPGLCIHIDGTLGGYRDLLRIVAARVPGNTVTERARRSLRHMRVMT